MDTLTFLLSGTLLAGTPLLIAALGELVTEKAGVLNLSIEGMMAIGAVIGFAIAATTGSYWLALLGGGLAAAALAAVKLARRDYWRRNKLEAGIARLRAGAARDGFELLPSDTPIQPLLCGDDATALAMAAALEEQGYWVSAIRPPSVPEGQARLRITLSALHSDADIDGLLDALRWARDAAGLGYGSLAHA